MKKIKYLFLFLLLVITMMTGCKSKEEDKTTSKVDSENTITPEPKKDDAVEDEGIDEDEAMAILEQYIMDTIDTTNIHRLGYRSEGVKTIEEINDTCYVYQVSEETDEVSTTIGFYAISTDGTKLYMMDPVSGLYAVAPVKEAPVTKELIDTVLLYDTFDWGLADQEGRLRMATEIISIFAEIDGPIDMNPEELVAALSDLLLMEDQLNVFEVACSIYEFDPNTYQQYSESLETPDTFTDEPTPQLLSQVLHYDIFDWQLADDSGKLTIATDIVHILTYYELLWYTSILEMNPQDFVNIINSELENIGQSSLFVFIGNKLGFDVQPYYDFESNQ